MQIRALVAATAALAAVAAVPLTPEDVEPSCGAGHELVTTEGLELTFDTPYTTAPELAATGDVTGDVISRQRGGHFHLAPWVAPAEEAKVTFELAFGSGQGDYDLFLYDEEGFEIGRSATANIEEGVTGETIAATLDHCQHVMLRVASWAGAPAGETLTLTVTVEPKEGEATEPAPERRTFYLTSDRPGQASMAGGAPNNLESDGYPLTSGITEERPTGGVPNSYTRAVVGFDDPRNALVPYFDSELDEEISFRRASAVVWVSSQIMDGASTLTIDLLVDYGKAVSVPIPGDMIGDTPTPIVVDFGEVDIEDAYALGLQIATAPAVASDGGSGNTSDAQHTVWYDAIQFPSNLILDL